MVVAASQRRVFPLTGQPEAGDDSCIHGRPTESVLYPIVMEGEGMSGPRDRRYIAWLLMSLACAFPDARAQEESRHASTWSDLIDSDTAADPDDIGAMTLLSEEADAPFSDTGFASLASFDESSEDQSDDTPKEDASSEAKETFDEQLAKLQKRIDQLESTEKKRVESEKKKKEEEARKADGWQDMSTDKWAVRLGGHVQLEYINWANADPAIPDTNDYFEFRRLRLLADGTGYGQLDFRLQMTLEPETVGTSPAGTVTSPDVKDAYFSINETPIGRLRIGNFFVPFGLEQVTNDTNNIFLERSIPTQGVFCVDREVGIALYNHSDDQSIGWATGIFLDSISEGLKERIDDNQGCRVSGRLTWTPFYDEPSNGRYLIHTGIGVLHTQDQDGVVSFRTRPQVHEGPRLINSGNITADHYTTGNVEFAAVMGPVTLQSEGFICSVDTQTGAESLSGAYAHLSYFITGENRIYDRFGQHGAQFGRNAPISNFFWAPGAFSPGAVELKTRYSHLNMDQINRGQYNDITTGFNWYWNDRTRIMFDWIHPVTTAQTTFGATESDLLAMRFDFNW